MKGHRPIQRIAFWPMLNGTVKRQRQRQRMPLQLLRVTARTYLLRMEHEARHHVAIILIVAILTTEVATDINREVVVVVEDVEVALVNHTTAKPATLFNDLTQRMNTMGGDRLLVSSIGNRKEHRMVVCGDGKQLVRKHHQEHRKKMLQI